VDLLVVAGIVSDEVAFLGATDKSRIDISEQRAAATSKSILMQTLLVLRD
jgi:hypothetical protein